MAKCPFAKWTPISGSVGAYLGGPFKIVHHTTEGSTASGAIAAYKANKSDPHFTVDATTIYQHIDTSVASRSLENRSGGIQTNRDSAIQIEVVGFAGQPKNRETLQNVAKLCRWIESTHDIPLLWPNGFPKAGSRDPGGHNRNSTNWDQLGGHYGHSQVPENTHWDPGYTKAELEVVMGGVLETIATGQPFAGRESVVARTSTKRIDVELLEGVSLSTYLVAVQLDGYGQGLSPLAIAWERIISVIPNAIQPSKGELWQSCSASLAIVDGQSLLVATEGPPNSTAVIMVKVLDTASLPEDHSLGCCP